MNVEIIVPVPLSFGRNGRSPFGPTHNFFRNKNCLKIASSWPTKITALTSTGFLILRMPPKGSNMSRSSHSCKANAIYDQVDLPTCRTFISGERHVKVSAELIAERFGIGPTLAQRTLRVTTQQGVRSAILPISRRYRAHWVFGVKRLNGKFATDTAYGKIRSLGARMQAHSCTLTNVELKHCAQSRRLIVTMLAVCSRNSSTIMVYQNTSLLMAPPFRLERRRNCLMEAIRKYEIKYHVFGCSPTPQQ